MEGCVSQRSVVRRRDGLSARCRGQCVVRFEGGPQSESAAPNSCAKSWALAKRSRDMEDYFDVVEGIQIEGHDADHGCGF